MILGRWYRIGCKVFRFNNGVSPECIDMDHGDYGAEGDIDGIDTFVSAGYRDHWVLLADLCLRIAEQCKPLQRAYGPSRREVRLARQGISVTVMSAQDGISKWADSMVDEDDDSGPEDYDKVYGMVKR